MNKSALVIVFLLLSFQSLSKVEVVENCYLQSNEDILLMNMFPWNQSPEEMKENFNLIYNSNKRMDNRVFFDGESFKMPFKSYSDKTLYATVPENFINSIIAHIESALDKDYVEHINFSDMGHNHLFIPQKFYDEEISGLSMSTEKDILYEKLMGNTDLKILYHTAEQLEFFDDSDNLLESREIQKRFYTRNILGQNNGSQNLEILFNLEASGNAAHDYKVGKYKYWGAGFSFSSTSKGCFSYMKNGKRHFFDISAEDIGYGSSF